MAYLEQYQAPIVEEWGRPKVRIAGVDATFHTDRQGNAILTGIGPHTITDPFGFAGGSLSFPGFDPHLDEVGVGRWAILTENANVKIIRDAPDAADDEILYEGLVGAFNVTKTGLDIALEGEVFAAFSHNVRTPTKTSARRKLVEDVVGDIWSKYRPDSLARLKFKVPKKGTGIRYAASGEWDSPLAAITGALEAAIDDSGMQYTIRANGAGGYVFRKQTPGRVWTIVNGQPGAGISLQTDYRAQADAIFGSGTTKKGDWNNTHYPGTGSSRELPPLYPRGTKTFEAGKKLPAAIGGPLWGRMRALGYPCVSKANWYSKSDVAEIKHVQRILDLEPDGIVSSELWQALLSPGMDEDREGPAVILPLVQKKWVPEWLRAADGARLRRNPVHNPNRPVNARHIDFGEMSRADASDLAARIMKRERVALTSGTVALDADPREGHRFEITAGDRLVIKRWGGGEVALHISEVTRDLRAGTVSLTVSTRLGPYPTLREESRGQGYRVGRGQKTKAKKKATSKWDGASTMGKFKTSTLAAGEGHVIKVPMPESGSWEQVSIVASAPIEFIAAVFSDPVTAREVEGAIGGNPFSFLGGAPKKEANPTWGAAERLAQMGQIAWWGSAKAPLGWGFYSRPSTEDLTIGGPELSGAFYERVVTAFEAYTPPVKDEERDGPGEDSESEQQGVEKEPRYDIFVVIWPLGSASFEGSFSAIASRDLRNEGSEGTDEPEEDEVASA